MGVHPTDTRLNPPPYKDVNQRTRTRANVLSFRERTMLLPWQHTVWPVQLVPLTPMMVSGEQLTVISGGIIRHAHEHKGLGISGAELTTNLAGQARQEEANENGGETVESSVALEVAIRKNASLPRARQLLTDCSCWQH
jgi:hypothetical protein